jgi:nitrogen-specific signal transduction histidine kinase
MNDVVSRTAQSEDRIRFGEAAPSGCRSTGVNPVDLDHLAHELRQPLSAIESLACYLEMTVADEQVCSHLQRIRAMVFKAHQVLEKTINS